MTPAGVMRPIFCVLASINQRLPSGPRVMASGPLLAVGKGNSAVAPLGFSRPILFPRYSVNQRLPSGPVVMPEGWLFTVGTAYSCAKNNAGVIFPILLPVLSVNQRLPSGPAAISKAPPVTGHSVVNPLGFICPT